ncbi:uncharacterized protein LACBIDRAFT_328087 [Laccaria bicolor S238N-H82]|uniref:Predicted protein n=1 Tax=Laccaria bicolor (strain S238N-H82 / ATCC MYA-4686) TaxID=486041 RepID=B0DDQ4_LACBS|nr:uncharacterized protein LACBIDRAFT_328087 [Laccaria bicolor S238N-H82]EDR07252.1 predicted protein [Laccaria bicolor S238N-H82]|eukprot:XP_001882183.1 predicted protein [Laccaria bicolor S238N-H82]
MQNRGFPSEGPSYDGLLALHPSPEADNHQHITVNDTQEDDGGLDDSGLPRSHAEPKGKDLPELPHDILSLIFWHACQPVLSARSEYGPRWERTFYPLWLGKISRSWRETAWASSELWEIIVLRINFKKIGIQTDLLREWFGRAKGRLLDVYIEEPHRAHKLIIPLIRDTRSRVELLDLISQHSEQFQRIDLHLPFHLYQYFADSTSTRPTSEGPAYPLLRYASLNFREKEEVPEIPELGFKEAPFLCTLSLSSFRMRPNGLSFCPTKQITRLVLDSCRNLILKNLLSDFPRLNELTLTKCKFSHSRPILGGIVHNHLRILNVEFTMQVFAVPRSHVMSNSLPGLESISICVAEPLRSVDTQHIPPFLEHSRSILTCLTLEFLITAELEYQLIEFLSLPAISSLRELHIREYSIHGNLLRHLLGAGLGRTFFDVLHPDEDPNYLPHLEIIEYEGLLAVHAIDFIEPLIVRSRIRTRSDDPPSYEDSKNLGISEGVATLRKATIKADQYSEVASFSIAEYTDPHYVWEIIQLMEEGALRLLNMDGSLWE